MSAQGSEESLQALLYTLRACTKALQAVMQQQRAFKAYVSLSLSQEGLHDTALSQAQDLPDRKLAVLGVVLLQRGSDNNQVEVQENVCIHSCKVEKLKNSVRNRRADGFSSVLGQCTIT